MDSLFYLELYESKKLSQGLVLFLKVIVQFTDFIQLVIKAGGVAPHLQGQ